MSSTQTDLGKQANLIFAQNDGDQKVRFIRSLLPKLGDGSAEFGVTIGCVNMLMTRVNELEGIVRGLVNETEMVNNPNMNVVTANLALAEIQNDTHYERAGSFVRRSSLDFTIPEVNYGTKQVISKTVEFRITGTLNIGANFYATATVNLYPNPTSVLSLTTVYPNGGQDEVNFVAATTEIRWREDQVTDSSTPYRILLTIDWENIAWADDAFRVALASVGGGGVVTYNVTSVTANASAAYPRVPGTATHRNFTVRDGNVDNTRSTSDTFGWYQAFFEGLAAVSSKSAELTLNPELVKVFGDLFAILNNKKSDQDVYLEDIKDEAKDTNTNWGSWFSSIAKVGKTVVEYAPAFFETAWSVGSWLLAFL